jgi:hypothetical protein
MQIASLPRFLHALTAIHAVGACACFVMAIGSAISDDFRAALAVSGGSTIMVAWLQEWTWAFLLFVGAVLAILAYSSWCVRPWAWPMTLVVYGVGSLWQVSVGIPQGWVAASVNARSPRVREHTTCAPCLYLPLMLFRWQQ